MTPLRARLAFTAFLVLSGAIGVNALYLQEPQTKPSDLTGSIEATEDKQRAETRDTADTASQVAARDAAPVSDSPDDTPAGPTLPGADDDATDLPEAGGPAFGERDHAEPAGTGPRFEVGERRETAPTRTPTVRLVRAIQRELDQRGYNPGRQDGFVDVPTRMAILAYQYDAALKLTGAPSEALLKHILFGPFVMHPGGPAADERFERDPDLVLQLQRVLADLGYSAGPVSGRLGHETREAIRRFEQDRDMPETGRLSSRVLLELVIVTGQPFAGRG